MYFQMDHSRWFSLNTNEVKLVKTNSVFIFTSQTIHPSDSNNQQDTVGVDHFHFHFH